MKRTLVMIMLVSLMATPYAWSQMGGGDMRRDRENMMGSQGSQEPVEGMRQGHDLTGNMMHHMGHMTRMMQQVRDMIADNGDTERMARVSDLIDDMSEHLMTMSRVMQKGSASNKDMQELNQQNEMMQKKYEMMRWK